MSDQDRINRMKKGAFNAMNQRVNEKERDRKAETRYRSDSLRISLWALIIAVTGIVATILISFFR
jgi:hypothetical protein